MGNAHSTGQSRRRNRRLSDFNGDQKSPLLDAQPPPPHSPPVCRFLQLENRHHSSEDRTAERIVISQLKLRVSILEFLLKKQENDMKDMKQRNSATDVKLSELTSRIDDIADSSSNSKNKNNPNQPAARVPDLIDIDMDKIGNHHSHVPPIESLIVNSNYPATMVKSNPVDEEFDWNLHLMNFSTLLVVLLLSISVGLLL
ncbi:hypothetical protein LINPERPRIM_LOCUS3941 [Linum perenne]